MSYIDNPLNYEPIVYRDYFKNPIRKSMFGYLLSLVGVIAVFIFAFPHVQTSVLVPIMVILIFLNFYLFFYDKSIHFTPKISKSDLNKIKLPSLQTYITEISLDPAQNTKKELFGRINLDNCNIMLFSNRSNHKVVAVMGLSLKSTALHIQSNFENFLRVLYSLELNIPLTFQIDLKNTSANYKESNSIYGDRVKNLKNNTLSRESHSVFEYTIFITRTYRFPSIRTIDNLLYTMKQSYITISNILETNFAHFKFSALYGNDLINGIRGSITGKRYDHVKKSKIRDSTPKNKGFVLWIRPLLAVLGNFGALWFLTGEINNEILIYCMVFLSILSCIILGLNFWWEHFFKFNGYNFGAIDLFPSGEFLYHKRSKSLHFYDFIKKKLHSNIFYSLTNFSKSFRFNQVKFYRSLLHHVVSGNFSVSVQFHTRRISSMDRFKNALWAEFWRLWDERPNIRPSLERRHCGYYIFQPIISVGIVRDQNITQVSDSDIANNVKTLQNTFLPLLNIGFPNCGVITIKPNIIYQYLTKSRLYSTFNSLPYLHFTTGISLIPFIAIPEEIHRYLPINYAGEFSTPLLQDEIIFGHAFNPENNSIETVGGISFNELKQNLIFLGESYENVQKGLTRVVAELLTHRFPCIIFDWDGTWRHLVGQLEYHNSLNKINYVSAGDNIGIKLFDLPYKRRGPLFISYISSIIDVFGRVFHYRDDQLALLKSAWLEAENKGTSINEICGNISNDGDGIKSLYRNKNPVIADLNLLQKDYLAKIFDVGIENWISLDLILDTSSTLIINLESLKDNNMKNLFIQSFLAQYQYIFEMELAKNNEKNSRMIIIPALDILFNDKIETRQNTQIASILSNLIKQQHILIGSGTNIVGIHHVVFNLFKNRFIFRNQLELNLRILEGYLNFDENFTNIQHLASSSRKISYQAFYLSTIDPNKCIILRPTYNTPYVFQFDYDDYFQSDEMNKISGSDIRKFELTPDRIISQKELEKYDTQLESDFRDNNISESLYLFLKNCDEKLGHVDYLTRDQIKTNLTELLSRIEPPYSPGHVEIIYGKFENLKYLEKVLTAGGKTHEIMGYKLTDIARTNIKNYEMIKKIGDYKNIIQDLPVVEIEEEIIVEKEENILPVTTLQNEISQEDKTIINKEWMDDFELELSEIIVPCRIKYEKGSYEESYNFLKSGWESAMKKIENYPQSNGLIEKLRERYQWIKETDFKNEHELLKLINRIEYFVISM